MKQPETNKNDKCLKLKPHEISTNRICIKIYGTKFLISLYVDFVAPSPGGAGPGTVPTLMQQLNNNVYTKKSKNVEILHLAAEVNTTRSSVVNFWAIYIIVCVLSSLVSVYLVRWRNCGWEMFLSSALCQNIFYQEIVVVLHDLTPLWSPFLS